MVYRAHHDPLTDLPNRAMFQDRLTQALARAKRQGRLVSVMFVDLDGFKRINDEYGHGTGDALLKVVGTRLTQCVRATDTVARLSGDEFTLILQDLERLQDIHLVAHKILDLMVQPVLLEGRSLSVKTSIGIAIIPLDATDPEGLLKHADRAMYKAKSRGDIVVSLRQKVLICSLLAFRSVQPNRSNREHSQALPPHSADRVLFSSFLTFCFLFPLGELDSLEKCNEC